MCLLQRTCLLWREGEMTVQDLKSLPSICSMARICVHAMFMLCSATWGGAACSASRILDASSRQHR